MTRVSGDASASSSASLAGYSLRQAAKLIGLEESAIRSLTNEGLLKARRDSSGAARFSFQDLVLLRAAKELREAQIPPRRIRAALARLAEQLPRGRPLTAVRITAHGGEVVVQEGDRVWNPESGQALFDFAVAELAAEAAPMTEERAAEVRSAAADASLGADEWYELACDLEAGGSAQAEQAYRHALELAPDHLEAHLDLGRLLHEAGRVVEAADHYRRALDRHPTEATAAFNLGVALEDLGRSEEALAAYERALTADPGYADAHFNAARLYEGSDDASAALRHLTAYRRLVRPGK